MSTEILLASTEASAALRGLLDAKRSEKPQMSMRFVCKRAGISSPGYLADVLSGRRKLGKKYVAPLAKTLELDALQTELFETLVGRDHAKDDEERKTIDAELAQLRRVMQMESQVAAGHLSPHDLAACMTVFSSLYLSQGRATRAQLRKLFETSFHLELDKAIATLKSVGLVSADGEQLVATTDWVMFSDPGKNLVTRAVIKGALSDAITKVDRWFADRSAALFGSTVFTARKADLAEALADLRRKLFRWQREVDVDDGDTLVQFNVQVYPVALRPKK